MKQVLASGTAALRPPNVQSDSGPQQISRALDGLCAEALAVGDCVACAIVWHRGVDDGIAHAPAQTAWRAPLNAVVALAQRQSEQFPANAIVRLETGQLRPIIGDRLTTGRSLQGVALAGGEAAASVTTIVLAPVGRPSAELEALVRLVCGQARGLITIEEIAASRAFWQRQASTSGERLVLAQSELTTITAAHAALENVVADCVNLRPRQRFAGLGARVARFASCPAWLVASRSEDELRVVASATALARIPALGSDSALDECIRRDTVTVRQRYTAPTAPEDWVFAAFPAYVCVPLSGGAIALAANGAIAPALIANLERLGRALGPIVDRWLAEEECARLQRLVRSLGLRMFGAIDSERARVARDLHDHQAQLLTAARIALAADPEAARGVLKQLDEALRLRVRELRPATLGRSTLREAIGYEIRRLADAGIKARLAHPERTKTIARPLQELCYQVAREAISNVIRHSGATRVEISTERRGGRVLIRIDDNGTGVAVPEALRPAANGAVGMGLAGMAERLKLMGGQLSLERVGGITRLTAEAPER